MVQLTALLLVSIYFARSAPTLQNAEEAQDPAQIPLGMPSAGQALGAGWEEARQIWNGVRTLKKQLAAREREKRSESDPTPSAHTNPDNFALSNISAPAYVKELYLNLTRQDSEEIDATTIRALPAMYSGEGNGK